MMIKKRFFVGFALLLIMTASIKAASAAQIILAWDPNTEKDLAGYKVYCGTSPWEFGEPIKLGKVTTYTLTGLTKGETYYIAITAYDRTKHESGFSNQVPGIARDIPYGEWVFDIASGDKSGVVIQFEDSDNIFWGYGISNRFDFFNIEGSYNVDDSNNMSGTYIVYDFDNPQSILETGSLSGEVDKKGTAVTLEMENWSTTIKGTRFLKDPYNPKYPVIPNDWTVKITGAIKGTVDPMKIEPYSIEDELNSHMFKISGAVNTTSTGSFHLLGLFLLTLTTQNKVYGRYDYYDSSETVLETGFFSGTLNRPMTRFNFSLIGDNGKKSTYTGQVKPSSNKDE